MNEAVKNETSAYRQRGFICQACKETILVLSGDPAPAVCPICSAQDPVLEWDHDVVTTSTVTSFPPGSR